MLPGAAGAHYDPSTPVTGCRVRVRRDPTDSDAADQRRDETPAERLDRNTIELLNELRVAATGILVLISDVVFGGAVTPIVGVVAGGSIATLWFVVPLNRRRHV